MLLSVLLEGAVRWCIDVHSSVLMPHDFGSRWAAMASQRMRTTDIVGAEVLPAISDDWLH